MYKSSLLFSLFALALFGYAQTRGWSLFADMASSAPVSRSATGAHVYHK